MNADLPASERSIRVVLVVDSPELLRRAAELAATIARLELAGATATAAELFTRLRRSPGDLVLTDLRLSGTGGLEATAQVEARGAAAPEVVIVTLHDGPEYRWAAAAAGADGFLAKGGLGTGLGAQLESLFASREAEP